MCFVPCAVCAHTSLLQDPSDKRYADCDETLEALTGEKRIMLFGGQKYFKEHFIK